MEKKEVKVFRLNDCDWWAAHSLEEAIKDGAACMGLTEDEVADEPRELTEKEMDEFDFVDENGERQSSFRERLQSLIKSGERFPCGFASSEW